MGLPKMPTAGKWTACEDAALLRYMQDDGLKNNWALLSHMPELKSRTATAIRNRWMNELRPGLVTGAFSKNEDAVIREHVDNKGAVGWGKLAIKMNRSEFSIRNRWSKVLRPGLEKKMLSTCKSVKTGHVPSAPEVPPSSRV